MAYVSLGHAIRNVLLKEEKEKNVNPAKKKGPPGGDWDEASEEERTGKAREIVNSVKTPGQKEVKEATKNAKMENAPPDTAGLTSSQSNPEPEDGGKKKKMKEAFGDAAGVEFGVEKESGGKKKVKEDLGLYGGATAGTMSKSMNTYEDGGKKKKIKEEAEGTKDRKTVENVARPKSVLTPFDRKSKLSKNAEIKTKIIDEDMKRASTIKKVVKSSKLTKHSEQSGNGPTKEVDGVVWNPNLIKPDKDTVSN